MEPVDGLDDAEHEGPGQVVDKVGEPGLDVEATKSGLVLVVLGLVVALVLGMREVRDLGEGLDVVRDLGEGLDVVAGGGALDDRPLGVPGEAVDDDSDVLAVLGGAPVVHVLPRPWLLLPDSALSLGFVLLPFAVLDAT